MNSPLEQFEIIVTYLDPITNFSLGTIWFILILIYLFTSFTGKTVKSYQKLGSILREICYNLYTTTRNSIGGNKTNYSFYGLIITLFISLVIINLLGMIPYSYTLTSQIVITFGLSIPVFITITSEALFLHGIKFLGFFVPAGAPTILLPLISIIELISYFARLFSLAIRLAANLISGHSLVKIIATTTWQFIIGSVFGLIAAIVPFVILYLLTILELAVALLQAYVFVLLTCSYLNDAIVLH